MSRRVGCTKTTEEGMGLLPRGLGPFPWLSGGAVSLGSLPCTYSPRPLQAAAVVLVLESIVWLP